MACFCFMGCNSSEQPNSKDTGTVQSVQQHSSQKVSVRRAAKSIEEVRNYIWKPNHPDTTSYLCELHFEDEYAMIFFHSQCIYFFFTYTTYAKDHQQVQLEWTFKTDCLLNMSFLEKANGTNRHPKHGDLFAIYRLISDTTLSVEYKFPEWVQKVNKIAQDSLFPQTLYLEN